MRVNQIKQKLRRGRPTMGTWLTLGNLHAARILAKVGFDWLTLDMEHSPYDWREVANVMAVIATEGCVPLIRVPDHSHTLIKRALDAGAYGIVVPMVETVEQAQIAIAAAKYPPAGNRSVGSGMHNLNFDCEVEEYYLRANDQIAIILQTESPLGIKNAAEIYALPGFDAVMIGPNDLRYQMRSADGTFPTMEQLEAQIQSIVDLARSNGKPCGMHVMDAADAATRIFQGMQFVAVSSDLGMLARTAKDVVQALGLASTREMSKY